MPNPRVSLRFAGLLAAVFVTSFGLAACIENQPAPAEVQEMARLRDGEIILADCIAAQCSTLNLDGKRLSDYSAINGLAHIKVLMMSFTDFSDLSLIKDMPQLTELHIGSTEVSDLSGLSAFPNLVVLHAQDNYRIQDFGPIERLAKLEELAVGCTETNSVDYVASLPQLRRLNISGDCLTSVAGLVGHPSLETLDLGFQYELEDLSFLTTMPRLRQVSLQSNPAFSAVQAPILQQLRAKGVTAEYEAWIVEC
jgi:internalin A